MKDELTFTNRATFAVLEFRMLAVKDRTLDRMTFNFTALERRQKEAGNCLEWVKFKVISGHFKVHLHRLEKM